jgi:hypothetical protein
MGTVLGQLPRVVGLPQCRGGRSVHSGAALQSAQECFALAVQVDSAAQTVSQRPHGDGDGAGQGKRGRCRKDQRRVRFLGQHPRVVGMS